MHKQKEQTGEFWNNGKTDLEGGNMLYPIPAVMVSVTDGAGQDDIITVAWTGTICTNPRWFIYLSGQAAFHIIC